MTGDRTKASVAKPTTGQTTKTRSAKHHLPVKHLVDVRRIDPSQARKWQRWVERGEAVRLARGVYIPASLWREISQDPDAEAIKAQAYIVAEYLRYTHKIPALAAGKSAAFLHGLPLERFGPPETVELASPKRAMMGRNGRSERYLAAPGQGRRAVPIATEFGEIWTSGLLDTCHDLGLRHSLDDAVIATEAALHTKKLTWREWREWLEWQEGLCNPETKPHALNRKGTQRARTAARLITPCSESPRESQLKIRFWESGLPAPLQQVNILNADGWTIGRVDMFFDVGLAVEYDGREKYGTTEEAVRRALLQERQRENDIQARGITLLRVTAETYQTGTAIRQVSEHFDVLAARPARPPSTLFSGGTPAWS